MPERAVDTILWKLLVALALRTLLDAGTTLYVNGGDDMQIWREGQNTDPQLDCPIHNVYTTLKAEFFPSPLKI